MVDDRPETTESKPDSDRPKRAAPTIDLKASEVTSETARPDETASAETLATETASTPEAATDTPSAVPEPEPVQTPAYEPAPKPISPWIVAPLSGAVAAALVIGVGWMLGWPAIQPTPVAPQLNAAAIDDLTGRVAGLESKVAKPAAPSADAATVARIETMEKSLAALRSELSTARAQGEKLAAGLNEVKSMPRADGTPAPAPDFSAVDEKIAKLDSAIRTQAAELTRQGTRIAETKAVEAKPADDLPLRRVVSAALLDVLVRGGDPYQAALAAANSYAPNPDALKPLAAFAATGVPSPNRLSSELLALVPKLSPPAPQEAATAGSGIVERLQAGAAKMVRIERIDTSGTDRGAIVARVTAAALRNDANEARRELKTLAPADRAAAQAWLDKADARDAALAASRQFASDAMSALTKPGQ